MSVPVALVDFAQTEDYIATLTQFRTINVASQRMLYIFHCSNAVSLLLTYCYIEASPEHHRSFPQGPGPP